MRGFIGLLAFACQLVWLVSAEVALPRGAAGTTCRYLPGDAGWPSDSKWRALNATVGGRLIATNPIARVCHNPTYEEAACAALQQAWGPPAVQISEPAEFLTPWWLNQSCTPFTPRQQPCTLGNYASYSIEVSCPSDVAAGIAFAQRNNIRLSIKNTGHDFLGKSSGKGSLSLWTYNLKDIDFISSYRSSYYNGPALKIAAGVASGEATRIAAEKGYRVLVGNCPTVGAAGGFSQGGGFSVLSGLYGLSADNILEWEVVTAAGKLVKASPTQNSDLYWALCGGGGGTYGVVWSVTTRLFPEEPVAAAVFSFNITSAGGEEAYWKAVKVFHANLQPVVDTNGIVAAYTVTNDTLNMDLMLAVDGTTSTQLAQKMKPLTDALARECGLTLEKLGFATISDKSYYSLYSATLGPLLEIQSSPPVAGGRFLSRASITRNVTGIVSAMRTATVDGTFEMVCEGVNTKNPIRMSPVADNAVTEGWREALIICFIPARWNWQGLSGPADWPKVAQMQDRLLNVIQPAIEASTPGDGAYMSEASFAQKDFQTTFYGSKYARLRAIKKKYDPSDIFYAHTAVGSEAWARSADGRLCRTGN